MMMITKKHISKSHHCAPLQPDHPQTKFQQRFLTAIRLEAKLYHLQPKGQPPIGTLVCFFQNKIPIGNS